MSTAKDISNLQVLTCQVLTSQEENTDGGTHEKETFITSSLFISNINRLDMMSIGSIALNY